jgi:hypothetical protein
MRRSRGGKGGLVFVAELADPWGSSKVRGDVPDSLPAGVRGRTESSVAPIFHDIDNLPGFLHHAPTLRKTSMNRKTGFAVLSSAALVVALGGCQSDPNKVDLKSITGNLTPELMTTAERPVDVDVNWAVNANQDLRGGWRDLGRFWLTDRPSSLSPYPIMNTGGQP